MTADAILSQDRMNLTWDRRRPRESDVNARDISTIEPSAVVPVAYISAFCPHTARPLPVESGHGIIVLRQQLQYKNSGHVQWTDQKKPAISHSPELMWWWWWWWWSLCRAGNVFHTNEGAVLHSAEKGGLEVRCEQGGHGTPSSPRTLVCHSMLFLSFSPVILWIRCCQGMTRRLGHRVDPTITPRAATEDRRRDTGKC